MAAALVKRNGDVVDQISMAFRDDHEAALARAHALEVEAAQLRAEAVREQSRLSAVEVERDRLRAELRATRRTSSPVVGTARRSVPWVATGITTCIALLVITVAIGIRRDQVRATTPRNAHVLECVVRSEPPGAEVMWIQDVTIGRLVSHDVGVSIGKTPLAMPAWGWRLYTGRGTRLELHLAGHRPVTIDQPCANLTYRVEM